MSASDGVRTTTRTIPVTLAFAPQYLGFDHGSIDRRPASTGMVTVSDIDFSNVTAMSFWYQPQESWTTDYYSLANTGYGANGELRFIAATDGNLNAYDTATRPPVGFFGVTSASAYDWFCNYTSGSAFW